MSGQALVVGVVFATVGQTVRIILNHHVVGLEDKLENFPDVLKLHRILINSSLGLAFTDHPAQIGFASLLDNNCLSRDDTKACVSPYP